MENSSGVGDQAKKVVKGVGELTEKVKENPSLLLRRPKETKDADKKMADDDARKR